MPRESKVIADIKKALEEREALVFKYHGSPFSTIGFPDLIVILKGGETVYIEVKSNCSKIPEPIQLFMLNKLRNQGAKAGWTYSVDGALAICGLS